MLALLLSALLLQPAVAGRNKKPSPQELAQAATDAAMLQAIERAQAAAVAAPGEVNPVYAWAGALTGAAQTGTIGRGQVDDVALDAFFTAVNEIAGERAGGEIVGMAASIALADGRMGQALVLAEDALGSAPTNAALMTWFQVSNSPADSTTHCTATLAATRSDIQRFDTLTACSAILGADWAPAADQEWYVAEIARRASSQAAHTQQLQAEMAAYAAEMKTAHAAWEASHPEEAASSTLPGPSTVSVQMKVTCGEKVRMFEGSSPTSGGTYGWQSPNSVRSLTLRAGDVLCVVDDRDRVQSCWTASGGRVDLELSCEGFLQR